jgi:hypothetical protein
MRRGERRHIIGARMPGNRDQGMSAMRPNERKSPSRKGPSDVMSASGKMNKHSSWHEATSAV